MLSSRPKTSKLCPLTSESQTETKAKTKGAHHRGKRLQPYIFGIVNANPLWNLARYNNLQYHVCGM